MVPNPVAGNITREIAIHQQCHKWGLKSVGFVRRLDQVLNLKNLQVCYMSKPEVNPVRS